MNYQVFENVKRLITYPIRLVFGIFVITVGFFATDWNREDERKFFWKVFNNFFKPY